MSGSTQQLFSSILHYFESNYTITASGSSNIKLDTRTKNPNQFHKLFIEEKDKIADHAGMSEFYGLIEDLKKQKGFDITKTLEYMSDKLFEALKIKASKSYKESLTVAKIDLATGKAFDYSGYLPVLDIGSKQRLMFNSRINAINPDVIYDSWKEWVATRGTEDRKILMGSVIPAKIEYNPYVAHDVSNTVEQDQEEVLTLNAHTTPDWRLNNVKENPKLPKKFIQLMEHLFPLEESRDYVMHWMNFMLLDKNQCILFLYGEQGIGKGTLALLLRKLVGHENFAAVGPEFWQARFNGELKYKRCVFFDECEIDKDNTTRIRAMTNKYISFEEKGIQTITLENHASYVWAINPDKRVLMTYDDRRYSVPNLGKENIQDKFGADWMDELTLSIETDRDFLSNIGFWIMANGNKGNFNTTQPYKKDDFYKLVERALSLWQRQLIDVLESRENDKYNLDDLADVLRGTGRTKVQGFLETHKDCDGETYGYMGQDKDGRHIKVAEKYYPVIGEKKEEEKFDEVEF